MNELKLYQQALREALSVLDECEVAPSEALLDLEHTLDRLESEYLFNLGSFAFQSLVPFDIPKGE
jgi:hypothetical protein